MNPVAKKMVQAATGTAGAQRRELPQESLLRLSLSMNYRPEDVPRHAKGVERALETLDAAPLRNALSAFSPGQLESLERVAADQGLVRLAGVVKALRSPPAGAKEPVDSAETSAAASWILQTEVKRPVFVPEPYRIYRSERTVGERAYPLDFVLSPKAERKFLDEGLQLDVQSLELVAKDGRRTPLVGQEEYLEDAGEPLPRGAVYSRRARMAGIPKDLELSAENGQLLWKVRDYHRDLSGKVHRRAVEAVWNRPFSDFERRSFQDAYAAVRERWARVQVALAKLPPGAPERGALDEAAAALDKGRLRQSHTLTGASAQLESSPEIARANVGTAGARVAEWTASGQPLRREDLQAWNEAYGEGLPNNGHAAGEVRTWSVHLDSLPAMDGAEVPSALEGFVRWYNESAEAGMEPIELAARAYQRLVSIHPFADANGRTSRALMEATLERAGLPAVPLRQSPNVAILAQSPAQRGPALPVRALIGGLEDALQKYENALGLV